LLDVLTWLTFPRVSTPVILCFLDNYKLPVILP